MIVTACGNYVQDLLGSSLLLVRGQIAVQLPPVAPSTAALAATPCTLLGCRKVREHVMSCCRVVAFQAQMHAYACDDMCPSQTSTQRRISALQCVTCAANSPNDLRIIHAVQT